MSDSIYKIDPEYPHLGGNTYGCDPGTFYPDLWEWLVQKFQIRTVLDVGCGQGYAVEEFNKLGCDAVGFDGLKSNIDHCNEKCFVHDLTQGPVSGISVDMIWCCEVVGHIEEQYVPNILDTFKCGKYITMTHERVQDKEGGYHHVNCQDEPYWIERIIGIGYEYLKEASMYARTLTGEGWFTRTGKIFRKDGTC